MRVITMLPALNFVAAFYRGRAACTFVAFTTKGGFMSYQNDIFIDNCVMRLVQIACAIRQTCERSEQEFDAEEIECQEIDGIE